MRAELGSHRVRVVVGALLLAGTVAATSAAASAAATEDGTRLASQAPIISGALSGVAALSAKNAWAVGYREPSANTDVTLILHWNGTTWRQVPSPSPAGGSGAGLDGVAFSSGGNGWAVGTDGRTNDDLILRWNGKAWKQVPCPSPGSYPFLSDVAAVSATDAWAVGATHNSTDTTLTSFILHWNGKAWKQVPIPKPGAFTELFGVAAARNIWAVGLFQVRLGYRAGGALLLHWNGKAWKQLRTPTPGAGPSYNAVAAVSASDAWAVGSTGINTTATLTERWNGTAWKHVPSPNRAGSNDFYAVAAVSASDAWAVGATLNPVTVTLTERWNGKTWKVVPSPAHNDALSGVAAASPDAAWAVGESFTSGDILILDWNGTAWTASN